MSRKKKKNQEKEETTDKEEEELSETEFKEKLKALLAVPKKASRKQTGNQDTKDSR